MKPPKSSPKRNSFCSKLSTASLDFNGGEFNLEFASNNGKFQTKFGGYLTLIVFFTTILAFVFSVSQFFADNSPVVNITPEFNVDKVEMNLYDEDLVMPLMFKKGRKLISTAEELSRYFTVRLLATDWVFDVEARRFKLNWAHEFKLILCKDVDQKSNKIKLLVEKLFEKTKELQKYLFCPDLGDKKEFLKLMTTKTRVLFTFIRVRFYPCSLPDPSNCATAAELDDIEVSFYSNKKILEASDYQNPIKYTPKRHKLKVDRSTRKILKYYFDPNVIVDDSTQIRAARTRTQFVTAALEGDNKRSRDPRIMTCTAQQISLGLYSRCNHLLEMEYIPRTNIIKTRRSYKKASIMLGEFGGYLKIFITLAFLLYGIQASSKLKSYLAGQLYPEAGLTNKNHKNKIGSHQSLQKKHKKEGKSSIFDIVDDLVDVEDFQDNLNLIEILKHFLVEEERGDLINVLIAEKKASKFLKTNKKVGSNNSNRLPKKDRESNELIAKSLPSPGALFSAYKKVKANSKGPSSKIKHLINNYFIEILKDDFEAEEQFSR